MLRATVALVLLVVFTAVAFGWRTVVQLRRHGDTGWRIAPDGGLVARLAHGSFVVALLLALAAPIAALVAGAADEPAGLGRLVDGGLGTGAAIAGALLMATGSVLAVVAQVQMGASWRIGVDEHETTELVTGGLFRSVRNPIFTGMLLGIAGEALLVPSAVGIAALAVAVLGLELQVRRVEEPYLLATHGDRYRSWAAGAGRFLPVIGRLAPPPATDPERGPARSRGGQVPAAR